MVEKNKRSKTLKEVASSDIRICKELLSDYVYRILQKEIFIVKNIRMWMMGGT